MTNRVNSASAEMNVDEWLSHNEGGGSGKATFLKMNFKDTKEYRIWVHPKSRFQVRWSNVWKTIRNDKMSILRWNSLENGKTLDGMRWKNKDGSFQHSPKVDPFMLLQEFVNMEIVKGTIDFTDEIFEWEVDDEKTVIHAGGFTGIFQSQKLSDDEREAMRKIGVRQTDAYMEDGRPREETIVIVVDNDNPEVGPQIVTLGKGLGKAFALEISKRRDKFTKNPDKGNIFKNPVCWSIKKDSSGDGPPKYIITDTDDEVTEDVQAAFDAEAPSIDKMLEPSNVVQLEREFKTYWSHEVAPDWDELFAPAYQLLKGTPAVEEPTSFNFGANEEKEVKDVPKFEKKTESSGTSKKGLVPDPEPEAKEEVVDGGGECENCGKMIPPDAFTDDGAECPHCHAKYKIEGDEYVLVKEEEKPKKPQIKASRRPKE